MAGVALATGNLEFASLFRIVCGKEFIGLAGELALMVFPPEIKLHPWATEDGREVKLSVSPKLLISRMRPLCTMHIHSSNIRVKCL